MIDCGEDVGMRDWGFKYPIGQVVRLKAGGVARGWERPVEMNARWMINGQQLDICSGGLQRQYICRGVTQGGRYVSTSTLFHEHELEACEPFSCETEDQTKKVEEPRP